MSHQMNKIMIVIARARFWMIGGMLCCLWLMGDSATADTVIMHDGRRFEGQILLQDSHVVRIDTVIAGIRATLTLKRPEIDVVATDPLPVGFFDPPPVADRLSDSASFQASDNLYLEVPIHGSFGHSVFANGLRQVLAYAVRHQIPHVVFHVDSEGGNIDEAKAAYELLKHYDNKLTYHAVVRQCVGDALAVALWCDTVHLYPGSIIGGSNKKWSQRSDKYDPEEESIIRAQVANEVVVQTQQHRRHVRGSEMVRAMIDPAVQIAIWRGDNNQIVMGATVPPNVPHDQIVLTDGADSVLVLSANQAVELGADSFDGDVKELGETLGLSGWKRESDYGQRAMQEASAERHRRAKEAKSKYEAAAQKNIRRRQTAEQYIEHNLKQAAAWDPSKGSYATYSSRWRWGSESTTRLTKDSREKWRDHTDASTTYLRQAAKGMKTIKKLDEEAAELGLERTYDPQQLSWMMNDIDAKYKFLQAHRRKTNK